MRTIRGIEVSKIALGTWAIGGGPDWGQNDDFTSSAAILHALELGINFIDTAPVYGNYHAEELLGRTLKSKRNKTVIATKCGLIPGGRAVKHCLKPRSVRSELEASLKRLQTDYIDLYFIHWPDRDTPLEDTLGEMSRLKQEGKIRLTGVSNFGPDLLKEAVKLADIAAVQNQYSFLNRQQGDEVFDICKKNDVAFLAYGPLAGGILSGKYKKEPNLANRDARSFFYKFYKGENFKTAGRAVEKLASVAKNHDATTAQAAVNWVLANPAVSAVAAGARTQQQAQDLAAALNWKMTKEDMEYLNEVH
jgi:aryl-alcohol dehydrogenase-like predicted oxidoreductase